jgi:hypothetical protein
MKIKRFKEYERINELSEFNLQRMVPDTAPNAIWSVDNPQLSHDAYDNKQSAINNALAKVNDILFKLSRTSTLSRLRSAIALEDQDLQSLKILRILKNDNMNYDVYITFSIEDMEYWGVVYDILSNNVDVESEVFKSLDLIQSKEWIIRIKGTIIKHIKNWMKPEPGRYKVLTNEVTCYSKETGKMLRMNKDMIINVVKSYGNEISVEYRNDYYRLVNDNFVYFNWWFEKV